MDQRNVEEKLAELSELRAFLEQQIRLVDDEIQVIQRAMLLVQQPTEIGESRVDAVDDTHQADRYEPSSYRHSGQRRAHIEIARDAALAHSGQAHLTSVAKEIISSGMSSAKKPTSVAANLHRAMSKSPEWEWVEAGVFRLLSYEPPAVQPSAEGGVGPVDREALPLHRDIRPVDGEADA